MKSNVRFIGKVKVNIKMRKPAIKKCKSVFGMIKVFDYSLFETELQQNNES